MDVPTFPASIWHVVGASVAGTSHQRTGRGCEDAHAYRRHGDLLLLAAADGAGSASQGAAGALAAIDGVLDAAERMLLQQREPAHEDEWRNVLTLVWQAAHEALVQLAVGWPSPPEQPSESLPLREFATTLLLAVVTVHWVAVAQIGDGAIVIQHVDGMTQSLTPPEQREYINETQFLTDHDYLLQTEYTILSRVGIRGIALLTDGLQMIAMKFPENTPHAPFFTSLFRFAAQPDATEAALRRFLEAERVNGYTDDDKTLLLAVHQ
jgi:serine/threonine protein phosphatase PrpC